MSLIYDALKKLEKPERVNPTVKINKTDKPKVKIYLVYTLVICLGFFIANLSFNLFSKPLPKPVPSKITPKDTTPVISKETPVSEKEVPLAPPEPKKEAAPTFVLNGVFFSGDEGYALINNHVVKEGDMVEGALVKKITLEEVVLDAQGVTITLYSGR